MCFIWGGHRGGGGGGGGGALKYNAGHCPRGGALKNMRGVLKTIPVQRRGSPEKKKAKW